MDQKEPLYLCMGSACHQRGVYHLLTKIQALLAEHHLENRIELKGSFCLGPCTDGIVLEYGNRLFVNIVVDNVEQKFKEEILPVLL